MYEDENTGIEWEGFFAFKDLSDLDEGDLKHHIIDGFITLARLKGTSIEYEMNGCRTAHLIVKASRGR